MTQQAKKLEFECTADESRVSVTGCGVKVEIGADGKVTVFSHPEARQPKPALQTTASAEALKVGEVMPDGTIYAGTSPHTRKPMYTTPKDAPTTCNFNEAADYASALDAHGHKDWRAPTKTELNVLFQNRAAIGNFDTSGSIPAGWYWSASRINNDGAWAQRFSDGYQFNDFRLIRSALRCVRG
jgi:Protein of unknown function (DUF1566)